MRARARVCVFLPFAKVHLLFKQVDVDHDGYIGVGDMVLFLTGAGCLYHGGYVTVPDIEG